MKDFVNILGTEYKIEVHKTSDDDELKENNWGGYCNGILKLIVLADTSEDEFYKYCNDKEKELIRKDTLRHELVHAFLNESGLSTNTLQYSGGWAKNEEMIDWIASQSPKIFKVFKECDCL
jgi:hypothetical protein